MSTEKITVYKLKEDLLPSIFIDTMKIIEYGNNPDNQKLIERVANLMEKGATKNLAIRIRNTVNKLLMADPHKIVKSASWIEKLNNKKINYKLNYQTSLDEIRCSLRDAEISANEVQVITGDLKDIIESLQVESNNLRIHIKAGVEFLDENPKCGMPSATSIEFDNPRERFSRKLTNLSALLSSIEVTLPQLKITRARTIDTLERFEEIKSVLFPVWRQYTLTLINSKNTNLRLNTEEKIAHYALIYSLKKTIENIVQ